jgi:four helix bundle protein
VVTNPSLQKFRTFHLAMDFHKACASLKIESPSLRAQLRRASESVVLTLAEGSAKPTAKDRQRFYAIALGSFRECQVALEMSGHSAVSARFTGLVEASTA